MLTDGTVTLMLAAVAWDTVFVAAAASSAPLAVVLANGWIARAAKREDWNRQDAVALAAERAVDAAEATAAAAQQIVATNVLASEQANASAAHAAEQAEHAKGVIDDIHTLVNSNLTAALKGQHAAVTGWLAVTRIVAQRDTGLAGSEAEGAVKVLEAQVAELASQIADRAQAQAIVDAKTS